MAKNNNNKDKFEIPVWREILKRIPNARNDWHQKKPHQKFCYLYGIGRMGMDPVAIPIFQDDQTLILYSFFGFAYTGVIFILMFFTLVRYTSVGEFTKGLPSTCLIIAVFSVNLNNYHFLRILLNFELYTQGTKV